MGAAQGQQQLSARHTGVNADYAHGWDGQTRADMVAKMQEGWPGATICGRGSEAVNAEPTVDTLLRICQQYRCTRIVNVGAGDLSWWPRALPAVHLDLVPRHADVVEFDACERVPPRADLIVCRYVLNHLSARRARDMLSNFRISGSTYVLLTMNANQRNYWADHELVLLAPVEVSADYARWTLDLYKAGDLP